jgi:hypothetical protein
MSDNRTTAIWSRAQRLAHRQEEMADAYLKLRGARGRGLERAVLGAGCVALRVAELAATCLIRFF